MAFKKFYCADERHRNCRFYIHQKSPGNPLRLDSVARVELATISEAPTKPCYAENLTKLHEILPIIRLIITMDHM